MTNEQFEMLAFLTSSEVDVKFYGSGKKGYWRLDVTHFADSWRVDGKSLYSVVEKAFQLYTHGGPE